MKKLFLSLLFLCLFSTALKAQVKVLAFAGSARADSFNKKLAQEAALIAAQMGADVKFIDLKDYPIPFYDGDYEAEKGMPENAKHLRKLMIESDLIVIASPNYNGSLTALLKNTLDWLSRSENKIASRDAFKGKTFVMMSASPGTKGGAKGLVHLRDILQDVGGVVSESEFSVGKAQMAFDKNGRLKDPLLHAKLQDVMLSVLSQKLDFVQNNN